MAIQTKPLDYININTVANDIDNIVIDFFQRRNIDLYDVTQCRNIPHNVFTLCMLQVYNKLFKPNHGVFNNQNSLIDYDNIELLTIIANKFIEWSLHFDKSMGIYQFSLLTGIHYTTLAKWANNPEVNPARSDIVKNIKEFHKMEQINLLNGSPVGALAVANNDSETGLNWSANNVQQVTNNTVYYLPSERTDKLKLDKLEN